MKKSNIRAPASRAKNGFLAMVKDFAPEKFDFAPKKNVIFQADEEVIRVLIIVLLES